ncbi:type II secretion system protein [bacterium]|nr:type II secretion system protein [bacterium]
MKNSYKGFTLAEVLITLVIIGVIAALTVPSLINKTNNEETVSRLKKVYSTLAQTTNLIIAEEGTPRADKGGWANSFDNVFNLYKKHMNKARECGSNDGCFEQLDNRGYKSLSGSYRYNNWNADTTEWARKLVLADGTQVVIEYYPTTANDCNGHWGGSDNFCFQIWADVNGSKKPNQYGRDVFMFAVKEQGLYPGGCDYDGECTTTSQGGGCACKVLREGAMNY